MADDETRKDERTTDMATTLVEILNKCIRRGMEVNESDP